MTSCRIALLVTFCVLAAMVGTNAGAQSGELPEAPGKAQVMAVCTRCHGVNLLVQRRSADEWSQVMGRMIGNGALMTDDQYSAVLNYLSSNLSDEKTPPAPPHG